MKNEKKQLPSPQDHLIGKEVHLPEIHYGKAGTKNNPICKVKKILFGKKHEKPLVLLDDNSIWGYKYIRIYDRKDKPVSVPDERPRNNTN